MRYDEALESYTKACADTAAFSHFIQVCVRWCDVNVDMTVESGFLTGQ